MAALVQQIDRVAEVVEETLKGNCVRLLGPKKHNRQRLGACIIRTSAHSLEYQVGRR